jgi:yeast amino acid transporter
MNWFGIGVTYIRFYQGMKAQGYDRKKLPYHHFMQPFAGYYVIFMTFFISLVSFVQKIGNDMLSLLSRQLSGFNLFLKGGWNTADFITQYLSFVSFFILYGIGKYLNRKPIVRVKDMDFTTGLEEVEANSYDETPPANVAERFWQWLVCAVELLQFKSILIDFQM